MRALELSATRRRKRRSNLLRSLRIARAQTDDFNSLTFQACQLDFKLYEATRRHNIVNLRKFYCDDLLRSKPEISMSLADDPQGGSVHRKLALSDPFPLALGLTP